MNIARSLARRSPMTAGVVLLLAALTSCTTTAPQVAATPDPLWAAYTAAVRSTAVYQSEHVKPLKPLAADAGGKVLVVTATGSVPANPLSKNTWVTLVPEVRDICRGWSGDVAMQLRQLLGLPPDVNVTRVVVMRANAADVFRPSPDPAIGTICPCSLPPAGGKCTFTPEQECGNQFPPNTSPAHISFIANQSLGARPIPRGYPWTALGYTYNWKPEAADSYGASEYVVRRQAQVEIIQAVSPQAYCAP